MIMKIQCTGFVFATGAKWLIALYAKLVCNTFPTEVL